MAVLEGLVLGGLDLDDDTNYILEGLDLGNPAKRPEWASAADADGALLVRDPLCDNRVITARIRITPQATITAALDKIAAISKKIEESEQQPDGLDLVWTPATTTTKALTFYVLSGQIDPLPVQVVGQDAGYFVAAPVITVKLTCKPFGYEAEVLYGTSTTSSDILPTLVVSGVAGDVPAEARLIVTDLATQSRRHLEWGLEWRNAGTLLTNLVTNPSFEVDTAGWLTTNGPVPIAGATLTRDTTQPYVGSAVGKVVTTTSANQGAGIPMNQTFFAGVTYSLTVRLRGNAGGEALYGRLQDYSGGALGGDAIAFVVVLTTSWQEFHLTWIPSADRTNAVFNVFTQTATAVTFYIDSVQVTQSAAALPYFDGSLPGCSWTGVANASASMSSPSLLVESDNMVVSGFAGVQSTRTGAWDPGATGNNVIRGTVVGSTTAVCGTGNLSHVGTFRVKARVYMVAASVASPVSVRLSWREGDGPLASNAWAVPIVNNGWCEVDLGLITVPAAQLGTQRWTGQIDSTGVAGDTIDIDVLQLLPAGEGYGKATNVASTVAGVVNAYDLFTGITAGTVLNARAAPSGGSWATSGATTDFTAADAPNATDETMTRATGSDASRRLAILGATSFTDTEVRVNAYIVMGAGSNPPVFMGALVRWVDSSNYLTAHVDAAGYFTVMKVVAGVSTTLALTNLTVSGYTWYMVRLAAYTSGVWLAQMLDSTGVVVLASLTGQETVLATAGALATGKPGFSDINNGASTTYARYYDNFSHAVPAAEQMVVYSGRAAEIRSDGTLRQDSTGTYYGRIPTYRGSRFLLPAAGDQNRPSRIAAKARRNNVDLAADDQIADSTKLEVRYRARHMIVRTT